MLGRHGEQCQPKRLLERLNQGRWRCRRDQPCAYTGPELDPNTARRWCDAFYNHVYIVHAPPRLVAQCTAAEGWGDYVAETEDGELAESKDGEVLSCRYRWVPADYKPPSEIRLMALGALRPAETEEQPTRKDTR